VIAKKLLLAYIALLANPSPKEFIAMNETLPKGEDLRRAVKWVSANLQENPDQPFQPLVQEAIFKFDLSPMDADFLIRFYSQTKEEE
jgi:hypothetical protein